MDWKRRLIGTWNWKRPLKSIAFVYGCLFVVAVFFAEKLIFFPPPVEYRDAPPLIKLASSNGDSIAALHLEAQPGKPTLLFTHGNAEDLADVEPLARVWHGEGFGVLLYDFPGYGRSSGKPTEASCEAAIDAAWRHLTVTRKIPPSSIVIFGRSVGGGPSVWLATRESPAGLILASPFTSTFRVKLPLPLFPRDRFPNLRRIAGLRCPLLVIHGEDDRIIPVSHGKTLVEAAPVTDKRFLGIPGAGHDDLFDVGGETVAEAIRGFVTRVTTANP